MAMAAASSSRSADFKGGAREADFSAAISRVSLNQARLRGESASQLVAALRRCSKVQDLESGKRLHRQAAESGLDSSGYVAAALIRMYCKCGSMGSARQVFEGVSHDGKNIGHWTALMAGYIRNRQSSVALDVFNRMDCAPDSIAFTFAIRACASLAGEQEHDADKDFYLQKGVSIHNRARDCGFESDLLLANALIDMYSRCGSMNRARDVFDRMILKDVASWTCLILGYAQIEEQSTALDLFFRMDCDPDSYAIRAAIKACGSLASKEQESGKQMCLNKGIAIHKRARDLDRLDSTTILASAMVEMYSKCGRMDLAKNVFDRMSKKDVTTWNSLILGYAKNGESLAAIDLIGFMDSEPDSFTFLIAIKACGSLAMEKQSSMQQQQQQQQMFLEKGISIHKQVRDRGLESNIFVASSLVDMYSKCGSMDRARDVFDRMSKKNVVTWNSLILGYAKNRQSLTALDLFLNRIDCEADQLTYLAAIKACSSLASEDESEIGFCLEIGSRIHREARDRGFDSHNALANTLVDMYSKCGRMDLAKNVFDRMSKKDVVSWNSIILGYAHNGEGSVALNLFSEMDCEADCFTYLGAIKACGSEKEGIAIHEEARNRGVEIDSFLENALIDMYSRCGSMDRARDLFDRMIWKTVVCWSSMIAGYVRNGESLAAMAIFSRMDCEPNDVVYLSALQAAGRLGALSVGEEIHARICRLGLEQKNPVVANTLIDFYGKCGSMSRAEEQFSNRCSPNLVAWNALIAGYSCNCSSSSSSSRVFIAAREMQEAGLQMDRVTLLCILAACSHAGLVDEGKAIICGYGAAIGMDVEHYTCVIDMLGRANRLHEALHLAKNIPFEADAAASAWTALLGACKERENLEIGRAAFQALQAAPSSQSYSLMIDILTRSKNPKFEGIS